MLAKIKPGILSAAFRLPRRSDFFRKLPVVLLFLRFILPLKHALLTELFYAIIQVSKRKVLAGVLSVALGALEWAGRTLLLLFQQMNGMLMKLESKNERYSKRAVF